MEAMLLCTVHFDKYLWWYFFWRLWKIWESTELLLYFAPSIYLLINLSIFYILWSFVVFFFKYHFGFWYFQEAKASKKKGLKTCPGCGTNFRTNQKLNRDAVYKYNIKIHLFILLFQIIILLETLTALRKLYM